MRATINKIFNHLSAIMPFQQSLKEARQVNAKLRKKVKKLEADTKKKNSLQKKRFVRYFQIHHPVENPCHAAVSTNITPPNEPLIRKIIAGYNHSYSFDHESQIWLRLVSIKEEIHEALIQRDFCKVQQIFQDPCSGPFFMGFETHRDVVDRVRKRIETGNDLDDGAFHGSLVLRLAEAFGVYRLANPERYPRRGLPPLPAVDEIMERIAEVLPFDLEIPNPYPGFVGISTPYGIATKRTLHALYVAKRISEYSPKNVLEIGSGLGWVPYYARKFGIERYVIIDIPMTAIASSHFLTTALGESEVSILGEERDAPINILLPSQFPENEKFDLIVNVDSLPELHIDAAKDYWNKIKRCSKRFLSINQEAESFTISELAKADPDVASYYRFPFWMRRGYVEEIIEFK